MRRICPRCPKPLGKFTLKVVRFGIFVTSMPGVRRHLRQLLRVHIPRFRNRPLPTLPGVATSGILAYYGIRFPHHRINIPKFFGVGMVKIGLSAWAFVLFYFATTLVDFFFQLRGAGVHVNYASHLGGLVFGAAFALLEQRRDQAAATPV